MRENAFSGRLDYKFSDNWSMYVRVFHDQGDNSDPPGVTGRRLAMTANPSNAVFNMQGLFGSGMMNDFKFGYNAATTTIGAATQPGFEASDVSLTARSPTPASPARASTHRRRLARRPGAREQRRQRPRRSLRPYSLTFADTLSRVDGQPLSRSAPTFA